MLEFDRELSDRLSARRFENVFADLGKLTSRERALVLFFAVELKDFLFLHYTGQKIVIAWPDDVSRAVQLFDQQDELSPDERLCTLFCLYLLDHVDEFLAERSGE